MSPTNPLDWFTKAEHDFGLANIANQHSPQYSDLICYHCQQAAEKYLKALILHHGLPLRKSHDLEELLDLLVNCDPLISREYYRQARIVNDYGVHIRYPGPSGDPSDADVKEALAAAAAFFQVYAKSTLGI